MDASACGFLALWVSPAPAFRGIFPWHSTPAGTSAALATPCDVAGAVAGPHWRDDVSSLFSATRNGFLALFLVEVLLCFFRSSVFLKQYVFFEEIGI